MKTAIDATLLALTASAVGITSSAPAISEDQSVPVSLAQIDADDERRRRRRRRHSRFRHRSRRSTRKYRFWAAQTSAGESKWDRRNRSRRNHRRRRWNVLANSDLPKAFCGSKHHWRETYHMHEEVSQVLLDQQFWSASGIYSYVLYKCFSYSKRILLFQLVH